MTKEIIIRNQHFTLHPSGVVFWIETNMLLVSDVHLGKINHFRKFGAAIPHEALYGNYHLLNSVIDHFNPRTICFLGDLFHSSINKEWEIFARWVKAISPEVILVTGNHDIISPVYYEDLGIALKSHWEIGFFLLTHHPTEKDGYFNFSGHIHPAVKLRGKGRQSLRLPCFFKSENRMILPAFGEFTGSHVLKPESGDEIYAIAKNEVVSIT